MQPERSALSEIVESIADGSSDVDWDAVESDVRSEQERRLIRELRVLARISEVHRSFDQEPEAGHRPAPPARPSDSLEEPAGAPVDVASKDELSAVGDSKIIGRIEPRGAASLAAATLVTEPEARDLWGPLHLVEKVGEGTFGEVYRAFDTQLQREVAVKLLRVGSSRDRLGDRVLREGRILARVRHPNVVVVHGAEDRDGRVGLWMEFIRGATLERLLKTQGTFSAREAALIGQDLCRAVAAVHGAGLVHRDIKAQNVMREEGGRVVLMDFGAGQPVERAPRGPARLTGTPLYLAPEVLDGGEATAQSDVYSLGVLLYYLVTGTFPMRAATLDELRALHLQGRGVRLHDARPDLPDAFVETVERAIAPEASARFASAGELQGALAQAIGLASRAAAAAVATAAPIERQPWRWHWSWVAASAGLVVAIGALLTLGLFRGGWGRTLGGPPIIAVLPFEAPDPSLATAALGATDAVREILSAIGDVRVISRTSVSAVKAENLGVPAIARRLGADYIIEGHLARSGGTLTASLQLVAGPSDHTLLAHAFPLDRSAMGRFQREVARSVASKVDVALPEAVAARFGSRASLPSGAQDLYEQGIVELDRNSLQGIDRAIELLSQSAEQQPDAAEVHAALARAYWARSAAGGEGRDRWYASAEASARRAIGIERSQADAQGVLADIFMVRDWNWTRAERAFQNALAASPSLSWARARYAMLLVAVGRTDEAVRQIDEALRLDPLAPATLLSAGTVRQYGGQLEEALAAAERGASLMPFDPAGEVVSGRILAALGRLDNARARFTRASELGTSHGMPYIEAELAALDAQAGRTQEARAALTRLDAEVAAGRLDPVMAAFVRGRLGDHDKAFSLIDQGVGARSFRLVWLRVDPRFSPLRDDPRYRQLVNRLGLGG